MNEREDFVNELSLEARFLLNILCAHVHQQAMPVIPNELNWRTFLTLCYATHYAGICLDLFKSYDSTEIPADVFLSGPRRESSGPSDQTLPREHSCSRLRRRSSHP